MTRTITCACGCGRVGRHHGRGLLASCWRREHRHGTLNGWPRTARPARDQLMRLADENIRGRIDDYIELREDHHVPLAEAAARLRVSTRTVTRWHSHLRAVGETYPWLFNHPATRDRKQAA
ncbi:hypothetical protein BJF83_17435 [Nocardiopsis sp. CNR-923]|uniref:hypothetical protein n=1 Tax=Nocardiopsis sp. CNR-923 TaxID=1904965 RepID=UPI000960A274|nr:hypothetical protein [Nocardiopsis sp. CNR-923]OLT27766.1 hypothetical protein BJF83_17435 [Nocardiopsis sp. CNR-923]